MNISPAARIAGGILFAIVVCATVLGAAYFTYKTLSGEVTPEFGAAIGELLLVVVLGAGEAVAFFELRHIVKERQFNCWLKAQEIWTDPEFVVERHNLLTKRLEKPGAPWGEKEMEAAKNTIRRYDEFVRLTPFLGTSIVLDTWDDPLGKAWFVLKQIVKDEQRDIGWSQKWGGFEKVGQKALDKLIREGRFDPSTLK